MVFVMTVGMMGSNSSSNEKLVFISDVTDARDLLIALLEHGSLSWRSISLPLPLRLDSVSFLRPTGT